MNDLTPIDTLTESEFQRIVQIAAEDAGLSIPVSKQSLVQSRVTRRIRELRLADSSEYFDLLDRDRSERSELICVLTTNVSHFYREDHHFKFIRDNVLSKPEKQKLRFWSAGCSNGQEPYTLAYEILSAIPDAAQRDILILASDIDPKVLAKAKSGLYKDTEVEGVPQQLRQKFFVQEGGNYRVKPDIANLIRFRQLNLNAEWPMRGPFDLIMCRNVVIYFNDATQKALWPRFAQLLNPGGILMLGHSERIHPIENSGFAAIGVTTYRKI